VEDRLRGVSADPASNSSAVLLRRTQIGALSDDADELALELQALAGPAPGPNGGEMFVDGFSGGAIPAKSAIRELRINSNPFSAEYDRPGFSRVEVFTKPGGDQFHGDAFAQFNDEYLNSRNPLLAGPKRPPYRVEVFGLDFGGPLSRNKAWFTLAAEYRTIDENAFILATTPAGRINEALPAPTSGWNIAPRIDYVLTPHNSLVARYQEKRLTLDNQGVGDFNLPSRAYREQQSQRTLQLTDTKTFSPRAVSETRFQYQRSTDQDTAAVNAPAIIVAGAFTDGGSSTGNSGSIAGNWEFGNITTFVRRAHTFKWGGRARDTRLHDTSLTNFAGSFTFYTLEQYQAGMPAQFSRNAGVPTTRVTQADAGVFFNDDWRVRPNLTFSLGLRYEAQTNLGDHRDWAPRAGIAWGSKTVLRAGFGPFYDRVPASVTLNALRYNGATQQSFLILNPTFYPVVPPLEAGSQQLRPVYRGLAAPRLYQASVGAERQVGKDTRVSLTWVGSRGVHLLDVRNVNAPTGGLYPYIDPSIRLLTESAGISSQNQLTANFAGALRRITFFGYYSLSYGKDDNESLPANPYNLRGEWGPSVYGDIRHRLLVSSTAPLPAKFSLSTFFVANSGVPYNITTGLDPLDTGAPEQRPSGLEHNAGRGPSAVNLALRLTRTWTIRQDSTLALTASTMNAPNHPNFAPPDGNMSSPYFGQYRALGGLIVMTHGGAAATYNRRIDLQVRFTF
jgi:TonB dependent receptor